MIVDEYKRKNEILAVSSPPSLQMDDEDTLLPRKLQAALEQALERKNDLINQDSDSESDEGKTVLEEILFTTESLWKRE